MAENKVTTREIEATTLRGYRATAGQRKRMEEAVAAMAAAVGESLIARALTMESGGVAAAAVALAKESGGVAAAVQSILTNPPTPATGMRNRLTKQAASVRQTMMSEGKDLPRNVRVAAEWFLAAMDDHLATSPDRVDEWFAYTLAVARAAQQEMLAQVEAANGRKAGNRSSAKARSQAAKERRDAIKHLVAALPEGDRRNATKALDALKSRGSTPPGTDGELRKAIRDVLRENRSAVR